MPTTTLVLWDVDHTLIETRGVGSELYQAAFEEITGRPLTRKAEVTGKTELAILAETLRLHDLEPIDDYTAKYKTALARLYEEHAGILRTRGRALPGADAALRALAERSNIVQSVLTGNLRAVAATKLRVFDLAEYVDLEVGAYGDDDEDRPKLVAIAQERARRAYAADFGPMNTIIIGDSPSDVQTAFVGGAQVIGVATGSSSLQELRECGASVVLPDLTDIERLNCSVVTYDMRSKDERKNNVMRRSGAQFGLTDEQWSEATREVREAILDAAYDRRMTWYGEVAGKVRVVHVDPYSALMNHLLGAVFEDERAAERPALTSIVTYKDGDKEPSAGFYEMARSLGYSFSEPFVFWAQQVQDVFKLYGKPPRRV